MFKLLNVGGNSKDIPLPTIYDGWEHVLLDIDPKNNPDIVCDARDMSKIKDKFDSVYCSHCLEHFYSFDVLKVLKGFKSVLKKGGFIYVRVPDLSAVIQKMSEDKLDLDNILYNSMAGPITPLDVFYGLQKEIKNSGQDWFAHKTGYTPKIMKKWLKEAGFRNIYIKQRDFELVVFAGHKLKPL